MSHSVVLCACQCTRLRRRPRSVVISLRRGKGSQSVEPGHVAAKERGAFDSAGLRAIFPCHPNYFSESAASILRIFTAETLPVGL